MEELASKAATGNVPWNRDETILALDLYLKRYPTLPDQKDPEVIALSDLLNRYAAKVGLVGDARLRNPNGVSMKVANLSRWDERDKRAGLRHGARLEGEVWADFGSNAERLRLIAAAIQAAIEHQPTSGPRGQLPSYVEAASEGELLTYLHTTRERDARLVRSKKAQVLQETGKLACEGCRFDFEATYGERGAGFIEAHHTKPLGAITGGRVTHLQDLALVCANCHRMIHATRDILSIEKLRELLRSAPPPKVGGKYTR